MNSLGFSCFLAPGGPNFIFEQVAMAGALSIEILENDTINAENDISKRLDYISSEYEKGWVCKYTKEKDLENI